MTLKGKPFCPRQPQPPSLAPPRLVPPRESPRLPLCHGGSVSRSPTYSLVLIPAPGPGVGWGGGRGEETRAPACAGNGEPPARLAGTDAGAARPQKRNHERPAADTPHCPVGVRPPPAAAGAPLVSGGPTAAAGGGGGEPHPGEPGRRRLLRAGSPTPVDTHARRNPQVYQVPAPPGGRASPVVPRLPYPHRSPLPGLRKPPPPRGDRKPAPSPPLRRNIQVLPAPSHPRGTREIRLEVSGEPHPGAGSTEARPRPAPPGRRFRAALARSPVARADPPAAAPPPPGGGRRAGCLRSAGRGGCAAERAGEAGGGDGGRRGGGGSPAPLQCPRPPSHSLSGGSGQRGGAEEGAAGGWGGVGGGAKKNGSRPALPRSPSGDRRPGGSLGETWRAGALPTPPNARGPDQTGRPSGPRRRSGSK